MIHCISLAEVFRLIDVQQRKIVEFAMVDLGKLEYAALSYVWGGPQRVTLLGENREQMQKDGALEDLPRTLADALAFTASLRLRFLWIDALCITQDSDDDKAIQIGNMSRIYSYSVLTIIAATGVTADAGLPGITKPRSSMQFEVPVPVPAGDIPESLVTTVTRLPHEEANFLTDTIWSTRGWTFQEREMAKRVIVFTDQQVYWACEATHGIEETQMESNLARCDWEQMDEPHSQMSDLTGNQAGKFQPASGDFVRCIQGYQKKNLTNQGDSLDAFSAILQGVEERTGEKFLWGLPRSIFDTAIWWDGSLDDGLISRRTCLTTRKMTSLKQRVPFPSWTWVGWQGATWVNSAGLYVFLCSIWFDVC